MNKHKGEKNLIQVIINLLIVSFLVLLQILALIFLYHGVNTLSIYAKTIFIIIKIIAVIYIMYKNINPSYKIIWILLIAFLPVFGVLMFTLYGNTGVRRKVHKKIEKDKDKASDYLKIKKEDYRILKEMDIQKYKQACFITNITDLPIYRSDKLEYLKIGEDYFEKLLNDLKKAEKYIFLEYFIISKSTMWNQIQEVLEEKSKNGVKIYIMTDQLGSMSRLPLGYKEHFELENVKTKKFNPLSPVISLHINYRDHRKIAVIDGRIAYTGGINIGDEYINKTSPYGHWKDFGIRLTGSAVKNFIVMFIDMWNMEEKQEKLEYSKFIEEEPEYPNDSNGFILPFCDGPNNVDNPAENTYINMINNAKKTIYITTPYLILDNLTLNALTNAALSGIDVRIIMPRIPDKKLVFILSQSYYDKLLKAGVKIYEYKPGFMHGKMCVVDSEVSVLGTINFDFRSLYLHYECGVWSYNTDMEKKLSDEFTKIQNESEQIHYEKWKKRNIFKKICEAILFLIAPLL